MGFGPGQSLTSQIVGPGGLYLVILHGGDYFWYVGRSHVGLTSLKKQNSHF